jgi:hypothetical protein
MALVQLARRFAECRVHFLSEGDHVMETSERFVSSHHHVVDWQLVRTTDNHQHDSDVRDVRERIRMLEAQAITLSRLLLSNPGSSTARESLAALDRQIASLRADLAWGRAEPHVA